MKRVLYAALVLLMASCSSAITTVNGELTHLTSDKVYLEIGDRVDTVAVNNGKFTILLNEEEPVSAVLRLDNESYIAQFYTEPGTITISGDVHDKKISVLGTPANEAMSAFMAEERLLDEEYNNIEYREQGEPIIRRYHELLNKTIEENRDNVFGVRLFLQTNGHEYTSKELLAYLDTLPTHLANLKYIAEVREGLKRRMSLEPQSEDSDIVPTYINVVLPNANGNDVRLSEVVAKYKYVLIDFWASWCGPCMNEVPYLVKDYAKYHSKGFEIYGISLDRREDAWQKALESKGMKWTNVLDSKCDVAHEYCVETIPTNFLVDCSTGRIIAKDLRGDAVAQKLAELLK